MKVEKVAEFKRKNTHTHNLHMPKEKLKLNTKC